MKSSKECLEVEAWLAGLLRGKDGEVADSSGWQQEQTGERRGWRVFVRLHTFTSVDSPAYF